MILEDCFPRSCCQTGDEVDGDIYLVDGFLVLDLIYSAIGDICYSNSVLTLYGFMQDFLAFLQAPVFGFEVSIAQFSPDFAFICSFKL